MRFGKSRWWDYLECQVGEYSFDKVKVKVSFWKLLSDLKKRIQGKAGGRDYLCQVGKDSLGTMVKISC
jgi:hypothetical protein